MLSHAGVLFMHLLSHLPLAWVRALGHALGSFLFVVAWPRRRVALTNLALCFPERSAKERHALARRTFVYFAQAWLDRSWLWHAPVAVLERRLKLSGAIQELHGDSPTVILAPHFVGLDAGWTALTLQLPRRFTTIYTPQANAVVDAWILAGRRRQGRVHLLVREDGVQGIISALRAGEPLYLLPDMNFGPEESIFVPFYGMQAATVPSLSRFAKLGRAKVVPTVTRMTPYGYEVQVLPAWTDFPTRDLVADTALMNARLQGYIDTMPDQYYWVHKRFKTRPAGEPSVY
ncbi:MAG TPA: lipid A biosynthesis acyltransferase [Burkholderiaceae bacterium]|nr:lipid A biosynthesis acyltransferase [Burkholderiaceae bacterium]